MKTVAALRALSGIVIAVGALVLKCAAADVPPPGQATNELRTWAPIETNAVNPTLRVPQNALTNENIAVAEPNLPPDKIMALQEKLEIGRLHRRDKDPGKAETAFLAILSSPAPEELKRSALLELAFLAQDQKAWGKAQQVYAQFLRRYPDDPSTPEVLLRQGLVFRQMGAPVMALSKFYAVISTALNLKLDQVAYYKRLVLQAQTEIADTYYLQGQFEEASDYFDRLLRLENPELNRAQILYKLVRCLTLVSKHVQAIAKAREFLTNYADANDAAEVRFLLAENLRKLGRNREATQEVLALLQMQPGASDRPDLRIYWQQRTGNEIGNQLYKEGDYVNALEIYVNLSTLDPSPTWQLPVLYQIGLIYERLEQPIKAIETYDKILAREKDVTNNLAGATGPTLLQMAAWRKQHLDWQTRAVRSNQDLRPHSEPSETIDN